MRYKIKILLLIVIYVTESLSTSEANSSDLSVLVVTLDSIHHMKPPSTLDRRAANTLSYGGHGNGYVKAIDFNYANKSFCYIQPKLLSRASELRCVAADNLTLAWTQPKPSLFPSQFTVSAMARDWASGAWYFADQGRRVLYVCDSSLQHCRVLRTDVEELLGLAVDPTPGNNGQKAGFIFWSQNNTDPSRLVRGSMAADELLGLLPQDCSGACGPRALTLDVDNKKLFWIDGSDVVAMCNYDGSSRRTVYKIHEAYNRDIKVLSVFDSTIYMPGYRSLATVSLNLEDASSDNITETFTNVQGFPSVALVFHGSRQPKVSHPCMENNGGCQHICVMAYQNDEPASHCLCQHGFEPETTRHGACSRIKLDSFMLLTHSWPSAVEIRAPAHPGIAPPTTGSHITAADVVIRSEFMYFSDIYDLNATERHSVVAVGFDFSTEGKEHFTFKNSWGDMWGDKGYANIKSGSCAIFTEVSYPVL